MKVRRYGEVAGRVGDKGPLEDMPGLGDGRKGEEAGRDEMEEGDGEVAVAGHTLGTEQSPRPLIGWLAQITVSGRRV